MEGAVWWRRCRDGVAGTDAVDEDVHPLTVTLPLAGDLYGVWVKTA